MTTATREESDVDDTTVDTGPEPDSGESQTEPAPEPAEDEGSTDSDPVDDTDGPHGEAARYRRRLRETEAERDALTARLEVAQSALVEHLVGGNVDLFFRVSGSTPADFFDETGAVNAEALETAQDDAFRELYGKRRRPGAPFDETGGWGDADGGGLGEPARTERTPTWSDALQASRRV